MDYGRALRVARATRAFSQQDLAKGAGFDASYISLIEKGQRAPSMRALSKIARALNLPVHLLVLLGSEREDLRGASPEQAQELGRHLLGLLAEASSSS